MNHASEQHHTRPGAIVSTAMASHLLTLWGRRSRCHCNSISSDLGLQSGVHAPRWPEATRWPL